MMLNLLIGLHLKLLMGLPIRVLGLELLGPHKIIGLDQEGNLGLQVLVLLRLYYLYGLSIEKLLPISDPYLMDGLLLLVQDE